MIGQWVSRSSTLVTVLALIRSPPYSHCASFVGGGSALGFVTRSTSSQLTMSKRVLVPIADGSEEIETTCITDTLVRFGAEVTIASVKPDGNLLCKMSRGIQIQADTTIAEAAQQEWDLIALPGGMPGAEHLRDCAPLIELLQKQQQAQKLYAAICASPAVVLATHHLLPTANRPTAGGGFATCYPAPVFREKLIAAGIESNDRVVVCENVTTSQGPGTSLQFALQLGEHLFGKAKRDEIAKIMLTE